MDVMLSVLWVAMVLFLLYETDAVYKYLRLFRRVLPERLSRMLEYDYYEYAKNGVSYSAFLQMCHPSFLLDLVMCRYCLGLWLALATAPICGILWTPVVYLGSQLTYSTFVTSEGILKKVKEKADE